MTHPDPSARSTKRILLGAVLALSLSFLFLTIGTALGSAFVPTDSGLAGPTIALGYGVFGALGGLALALFVAWRSSMGLVTKATVLAVVCCALAISAVGWRLKSLQKKEQTDQGPVTPRPSTATVNG